MHGGLIHLWVVQVVQTLIDDVGVQDAHVCVHLWRGKCVCTDSIWNVCITQRWTHGHLARTLTLLMRVRRPAPLIDANT